mmetsp:Transcript_8449/g.35301  ORF Transcript_8449/g.35301 Transcript_8449/m.35301 type:complete len:298 (+) Transcript_8449:76-969(+)|eukprot:CAMPEP_0114615694 /NCGR_PEP_ID=MMETSP0168-20121206/6298_1 /TAXON_ID=95228 ORGANISM="Vannella sp., Strain DIVA3 517/6/12" /NCGR_SAMPLE_ID=MMETSP0168 /ASSEMBLY_ACC=CAM_ASM_000044 /LENGTH=297 /DNA_ID=CAMNT_0001826775 /DNA_START=17 /DNA_END=910 /DNA_ORIENTATION=+
MSYQSPTSKLLEDHDMFEEDQAHIGEQRMQLQSQNMDAAKKMLKADNHRDPGPTDFAQLLSLLCFPFTIFGSWYCVKPSEEAVVLSFGKYAETAREPGIHFSTMWGRQMFKCSTKKASVELPKTTVIDSNGNPLIISAVVVYQFINTRRAVLDVDMAHNFVKSQGEAALKQTLSRFPYESNDGSPCLKTEAYEIGTHLCKVLQDKVSTAGALVHSFQLKEISYAPEIASGMLKRQQAIAIIEARQTIVQGAVEIATHALEKLNDNGIEMDEEERSRLVTNLLTVVCGENDAMPTLPM